MSQETFKEHTADDRRDFDGLKKGQQDIQDELTIIRENHLAHIQASMGELETNYKWLKWLLTGLVGGLGLIAVTVVSAAIKLTGAS